MWYKNVLTEDGEDTGERTTTKDYSEATRYYLDKSSLPKMIGGSMQMYPTKTLT